MDKKNRNIIFLHLDLGIGGAEQLILNLALALHHSTNIDNNTNNNTDSSIINNNKNPQNDNITILTTNCNPNHCFDAVKPPNGILYPNLQVYGSFLPANIKGYGTAFCSTLRMLYLCFIALAFYNFNEGIDLIVLDVLPTPIPLIKWICPWIRVLFYCHFPDKLLIRSTNSTAKPSRVRYWYRRILNFVEEYTMSFADLLVVNSKFTKETVSQHFSSIQSSSNSMKVLYPSMDMSKFIPPVENKDQESRDVVEVGPIISLNRYERKKNIEIILHAYATYKTKYYKQGEEFNEKNVLPPLIIAGGYDINNQENISYHDELQVLAYKTLNLSSDEVQFQRSTSDTQRQTLFQTASCLVYTPENEHFGIVPIEAMYAGIPVIARNSGGPCETVVHGQTGMLVEDESEMVQALYDLYSCERIYDGIEMGLKGHKHVSKHFHFDEFQKKFLELVDECLLLPNTGGYIRMIWIGFGIFLSSCLYWLLVYLPSLRI